MNEHIFNRQLRTRLPTEEQETWEKISTDYCGGEGKPRQEMEDILYEIKSNGQIGGQRL